MIRECKICRNIYDGKRGHCNYCGAIPIMRKHYNYTEDNKLIQLVAAYGAERVGQYRTRILRFESCDQE